MQTTMCMRFSKKPAHYPNVVVGMQHTELECWLLAGFDPQSEVEKARLDEICRGDDPGIGFDPRVLSKNLTATGPDDKKLSSKRVLRHLIGDNKSRAMDGLHHAKHKMLKSRGKGNGLAYFLEDIEQRLVRDVFNVRVADS